MHGPCTAHLASPPATHHYYNRVNSPELKYLGTDILIIYEYLGAPRMVKL